MTFIVLTVLVLATYRLARAIAQDDITEGARQWVLNRQWTWTYRLTSCTHCIGVWIALALSSLYVLVEGDEGWVEWLILWWAIAGGASLLATWATRD